MKHTNNTKRNLRARFEDHWKEIPPGASVDVSEEVGRRIGLEPVQTEPPKKPGHK